MAELHINIPEIKNNILKLSAYLKENDIHWSLITKVFSGDKDFLRRLLTPDVIENIHSIGDSRISSLKNLKEVNPEIRTIYIKPPARAHVQDVIKYADVSLNSSYETLIELSQEASRQKKTHDVIIMVELGELREGIERSELMSFYSQVFELPHLNVVGLGSNLGCMYGVQPTYDKLLQLCLYKELIEVRHNTKMELVSGGTSITLPLVEKGNVPKDLNHFRIGEAAFFGTSPLDDDVFRNLNRDTFQFFTNIIELAKKDRIPDGIISNANVGHTAKMENGDGEKATMKAILDFGLLDVDPDDLTSYDADIGFVGTTSDMTVIDLKKNLDKEGNRKYSVGDVLRLEPNYLAVARLLNSKFIDKVFMDEGEGQESSSVKPERKPSKLVEVSQEEKA